MTKLLKIYKFAHIYIEIFLQNKNEDVKSNIYIGISINFDDKKNP